MRIDDIARTAFGIIYLVGAAINLQFALLNPQVYKEFADFAIILYKTLWSSIVMPHLMTWIMLVVVFEITTGVLILSKGNLVKIGLAGCIIFNLFLIPFCWSGFALINLLFVLVQLFLLREEYNKTVIELIRGE
jgi:hypothetical protein